MMDKRTVLAFVLIAVVFIGWSIAMRMFGPEQPPPPTAQDSAKVPAQTLPVPGDKPTVSKAPPDARLGDRYGRLAQGNARYITVESPLYKAIINTRGGLLARFELKNHKTWYGAPVQLIADSAGFPGVLGIDFKSSDGRDISTEELVFNVEGPDSVAIGANDSVVITARLPIAGAAAPGDTTTGDTTGGSSNAASTAGIEKRFVFRGDSYGIGLQVTMQNMAEEIAKTSPGYDLTWRGGMKYQEHNSVDESGKAKAIAMSNGELLEVDAAEVGRTMDEKVNGPVNWVGMHVKYFGAALIPAKPEAGASARITGVAMSADSNGHVESYNLALRVPYTAGAQTQNFTLFVGPLDYDVVNAFGLSDMVDFGVRFIVRPIGEYVLLPVLNFLHSFIGNYGVVIIVFSLLIRLILWPLSIPQIKSSRKMQLLQPKVAEMREKYKDDPQRQQMEMMALYREYGINPVGGCLPMVLQLPILYALWATLSSAIELRQAGFALWIHDLSIPDHIIPLPFALPLLGDKLSGLALIMGATLFVQQKMMITDPKQKAMIYFMPILLTLAFNHLPSGLNLYYLTFNILSIGQQVYMTKFSKNPLTLEQMRAETKNKKKGWLAQKLEDAQKMAEAQNRMQGAGSDRKVDGRTPVEPRKRK